MRQLATAVAVAAVGMLVVSCGGSDKSSPSSSSAATSTTTTTASKPPLADVTLPNLLLTTADIDAALGVTGSKTDKTIDALKNDNPADGPIKAQRRGVHPRRHPCLTVRRHGTPRVGGV